MIPSTLIYPDLTMTAATMGFELPIGGKIRGVLSRCYVVQTAGSLDGFSYALYAAGYACPPGASPTLPVDAGCYNLVPLQTVASTFKDPQGVWPADGVNHLWQPYSTGPDNRNGSLLNLQQLYLYLSVSGAYAGKTFSTSLTLGDITYT